MAKANTKKTEEATRDIQLMTRLKEGDESAMRPLMDCHMHWVYQLAFRMCRSQEEAQDIAQEVFLKVWRVRETWVPKAKLSTWMYRVAVNICIDRLRKPKLVAVDGENLENQVMGVDGRKVADDLNTAKVLWRAINDLPARQRVAFILCQYEGQTMKEAAQIMDVSVGAIESLLVRSKKHLRQVLLPLAEDVIGTINKPQRGSKPVDERGGEMATSLDMNGTDHEV
jgi:RNA polymerase sigma-70 factor (ECF subfamily)